MARWLGVTLLVIFIGALAGCAQPGARVPEPDIAIYPEAAPAVDQPIADVWQRAQTRGMAFRGVGVDPSWILEIEKSREPALHFNLDHGTQLLTALWAKVDIDDARGSIDFSATAEEGVRVRVQLQLQPCSIVGVDGDFEATVSVRVDAATYRGCGRFLVP